MLMIFRPFHGSGQLSKQERYPVMGKIFPVRIGTPKEAQELIDGLGVYGDLLQKKNQLSIAEGVTVLESLHSAPVRKLFLFGIVCPLGIGGLRGVQ